MKTLVTGGTGFLGKPLIKRLLAQGHQVVTLARNEGKLIELQNEFPEVEIITGNCTSPFLLSKAMKNVQGVFHLAAFKHVGLAEKQPGECFKSNSIASYMLLEAVRQHKPEFVIGISTDKAAQVVGVYGATKLLMERFFADYQTINLDTKYRIVRYGNVLYSTGSVLTKWKQLIQEGKTVTVTDPEATRFFWTVDQAIDHIFECLDNADSAAPWIPKMKAMKIEDLLNAMRIKYAPEKVVQVTKIGLQPGENLHEKMHENGPYSNEVEKYTIDEILELI